MGADEFGRDFAEPDFVASDQNDRMTMAGKLAREFKTDAARRAGDQRSSFVICTALHLRASPAENEASRLAFHVPGWIERVKWPPLLICGLRANRSPPERPEAITSSAYRFEGKAAILSFLARLTISLRLMATSGTNNAM